MDLIYKRATFEDIDILTEICILILSIEERGLHTKH